MKIVFSKTFLKSISKLRDKQLRLTIADIILAIEKTEDIHKIPNLKKLKGFSEYYRIRVGDYRIGIKVEKQVVHFAVFEHRKDIYKRFP